MFRQFKRIKNLWALTQKDPEALKVLEGLSDEQLRLIPNEVKGDGKAEFFGEPTPEEELEFERQERGEDKWYKRILRKEDE